MFLSIYSLPLHDSSDAAYISKHTYTDRVHYEYIAHNVATLQNNRLRATLTFEFGWTI